MWSSPSSCKLSLIIFFREKIKLDYYYPLIVDNWLSVWLIWSTDFIDRFKLTTMINLIAYSYFIFIDWLFSTFDFYMYYITITSFILTTTVYGSSNSFYLLFLPIFVINISIFPIMMVPLHPEFLYMYNDIKRR